MHISYIKILHVFNMNGCSSGGDSGELVTVKQAFQIVFNLKFAWNNKCYILSCILLLIDMVLDFVSIMHIALGCVWPSIWLLFSF